MSENLAFLRPASFAVIALVVAGCDAPKPEPNNPSYRQWDSAGVTIISSNRPSLTPGEGIAPSPLMIVGAKETDSTQVFGNVVGAGRLGNGHIAVADGRALVVRMFNSDGKLERSIGRGGEGPGEFGMFISNFAVADGDTMVVLSNDKLSLMLPDGRLVKQIPVSGYKYQDRARDGSLFFMMRRSTTPQHGIPGITRDSGVVVRQREDQNVADTVAGPFFTRDYFEIKSGRIIGMGSLPFVTESLFALNSDGFYYSSGSDYEVRDYSNAGVLRRIIRIERKPKAATREDSIQYRTEMLARVRPEMRGDWSTLYDKLPFASTKPAITQLIVDNSGRLWAREFSFSSEPSQWLVIDAMGRLTDIVEIPRSSEIMDAGRDWLLLRVTDSLGVQTVQLNSLLRK
jgi:hypothetical protein